jgi:hypothetical protein
MQNFYFEIEGLVVLKEESTWYFFDYMALAEASK